MNKPFIASFVLCALFFGAVASALEPPRPGEWEALRQSPGFARHLAFAERLGNHLVHPERAEEFTARAAAQARLQRSALSRGASVEEAVDHSRDRYVPLALPPAWQGIPTKGTVQTLTLLIDFADHRAEVLTPDITADNVTANIYGAGTTEAQAYFPLESLHNYYDRASCGQLNIQGQVLGWYHFAGNRADYEPVEEGDHNSALFAMVREALQAYDATEDFSRFDNDNDGDIDGINIIWAGEPGEWASFWWGYQWSFFVEEAETTLFDGKRLLDFTWQWTATRSSGQDFDPTVLIHETGHLLGLPDYYDYDGSVGVPGGVGGYDMMHGNHMNHNAFSRWLLDWIVPVIVESGPPALQTLAASGLAQLNNNAVAFFPNVPSDGLGEFFIVENRLRIGNDSSPYYGDGLAVWHVDATLDDQGYNYRYNNSYTDRKLLALVQADGLGQIENDLPADDGDLYGPGQSFSPLTHPATTDYEGRHTMAFLQNISSIESTMSAEIGFLDSTLLVAQPQQLGGSLSSNAPFLQEVLEIRALNASLTYELQASQPWVTVQPVSGVLDDNVPVNIEVSIDATALSAGRHSATLMLTASGAANSPVQIPIDIHLNDLWMSLGLSGQKWFTSFDFPWETTTGTTHDGAAAATSAPVGANQTSWMETAMTGPGWVTFWWQVSSEEYADRLSVSLGDQLIAVISGEVPWQQQFVFIPPGTHWLSFAYSKDGSVDAGQDRGWVDEVVFQPLEEVNLGEALDTAAMFVTGSEHPWFGQTFVSHDGVDAAQSGFITDGGATLMETTVEGPVTVSFVWKVSSEADYDFLSFFIDGVLQASISGESDWATGSFPVPPGPHLLGWEYRKDSVYAAGRDSGWVDEVVFQPLEYMDLGEALDTATMFVTGSVGPWFGQKAVSHDGVDAAQSGPVRDGGALMETTVEGPGTVSFVWKVSSEADYDFLSFFIDGALQASISGESEWATVSFSLDSGPHLLGWEYRKDDVYAAGWDCGWVDEFDWQTTQPPVIEVQPIGLTALVGQPISLSVTVASQSGPLTFQWRKNGQDLVEASPLSGTQTDTLTIEALRLSDAGNYTVMLTNDFGQTLSEEALVVVETSIVDWQQQHFTPEQLADPAISGFLAMPLQDGLTNLVKYLLGLPPFSQDRSALPWQGTSEVDNGGHIFHHLTYRANIRANDPRLVWRYEVSEDLFAWHYNGDGGGPYYTINEFSLPDGTLQQEVVLSTPLSADHQQTIRLRVILND